MNLVFDISKNGQYKVVWETFFDTDVNIKTLSAYKTYNEEF